MATYLGETSVDVAAHPEYSKYTPADWGLLILTKYGGFDGAHHKTWAIDQAARVLLGTPVNVTLARWDNGREEERFDTGEPSAAYLAWRDGLQGETYDDGSREHDYDEGCPP